VIPELDLLRLRARLEGLEVIEEPWQSTGGYGLLVLGRNRRGGRLYSSMTLEEAYRRLLGDE
jgi:hypothetical protein